MTVFTIERRSDGWWAVALCSFRAFVDPCIAGQRCPRCGGEANPIGPFSSDTLAREAMAKR